jgi:hypothetical protein
MVVPAAPASAADAEFRESAHAGAIGIAAATKPAMACARTLICAPACRILPAINVPRISAAEHLVWRLWIG